MNTLGACVRGEGGGEEGGATGGVGEEVTAGCKGEAGNQSKSSTMDGPEASSAKKSGSDKPPSLSIDRAAFLILRVKKAFKKKRQQRKDRQ